MSFTKRLRDRVRSGEITCSVRIWMQPRVKVGGRYAMEEGQIEVDSVLPITLAEITPELARKSHFKGVVDQLKVAKHGRGESIFLVRFHYLPPARARKRALRQPAAKRFRSAMRARDAASACANAGSRSARART